MIAYSYDKNFYFAGVVSRQKNPIKKNEYLMPSGCTLIAPPDSSTYNADKVPKFNLDSQEWVLVNSPTKEQEDSDKLLIANNFGVLLYERNDSGEVVLRDESEVESETQLIESQAEKDQSLIDIKNTMDSNIVSKAMQITKGTSVESVQAFMSAFSLRASNPDEYANDGLVVRYAWGEYSLGGSLNTSEKIKEYYTGILIEMDKFRESEIATYIQAKYQIENP